VLSATPAYSIIVTMDSDRVAPDSDLNSILHDRSM
jgi:hypothetical protein